ncbi:MAG TPA: hypothetical protein VIH29_05495 [Gallionella sp.]
MLDQKLAEAMQRILSKDDKRTLLTATSQRLVDAGIGTKRGKSVYFTETDKAEMRAWLQAKGFSVGQVDLAGMPRSERLEVTPNEKAGGAPIKQNRVSIKSLVGQPLMIGGESIRLPVESHLDVDWTKIAEQIEHSCVMVVENYENFNRIHETKFDLPEAFCSPLVIYHGDPNESRLDNVQHFLNHINLSVLAFMDIDPAGIFMANKLPKLVAMIAPIKDTLEIQLSSPQTGRRDLFQSQYLNYGNALNDLPINSPCLSLWHLVEKHRAGIVQEHWIGCSESCVPWVKC